VKDEHDGRPADHQPQRWSLPRCERRPQADERPGRQQRSEEGQVRRRETVVRPVPLGVREVSVGGDEVASRFGRELALDAFFWCPPSLERTDLDTFQEAGSEVGIIASNGDEQGIMLFREGVLLARERYGESWLDVVSGNAALQNGHRRNFLPDAVITRATPISRDWVSDGVETFEEAGRRMLRQRLQKFLEYPDEVLRHEDVEAVHRMRVASRRLRATLDAFESCCNPKPFRRVYRRITKAADALGAARDADVMLQHLQESLEQSSGEARSGAQWLLDHLQNFRQEKQRELEHFLAGLDRDWLEKQIEACIPQKEEAWHGES